MKKVIVFVFSLILILSCQKTEPDKYSHEILHSVLWIQHSAEYKASAMQAYVSAQLMLDKALNDKNWTAATEQESEYQALPPAIILDVDETVLDNSPYETLLIKSGQSYSRDSWNAWCNQKSAGAVPGALEFCNYAHQKGVTVFYVTNRNDNLKEVTRENLKTVGFPLDPQNETVFTKTETSDKNARRSAVAENYRILLLIGDNAGDFYSGFTHSNQAYRDSLTTVYKYYWGTKWIVLPNPIYGDWESALFDYDYGLPESEKLRIKFNKLKD